MSFEDRNKKVRQMYRDLLETQVRSPQVCKEKEEFIKTYFDTGASPFNWRPYLIPVASSVAAVMAGLLIFFILKTPERAVTKISITEPVMTKVEESVSIYEVTESPTAVRPPLVEIKSLTSHVGPTMVYQKMYRQTPLTIVWVFPERGAEWQNTSEA